MKKMKEPNKNIYRDIEDESNKSIVYLDIASMISSVGGLLSGIYGVAQIDFSKNQISGNGLMGIGFCCLGYFSSKMFSLLGKVVRDNYLEKRLDNLESKLDNLKGKELK